jgi:hypothetical protein
MIFVGFISQSNLQKGLVLHQKKKKKKNFYVGQGYNIFIKKFKLNLTMSILKNLRTTVYLLLVLTNQVLLYVFKLKLKLISY